MPKGEHADKGRNHCLTHQQFDVTPARKNRRSLPYTPPKPGKSKRDKPQQRYHKLDPADLLECHQACQKPFLILDKAPGHVGKKSQAKLDEWWGKGNWMFQAGKMPDSNDGDVAVFPFMKRIIAGLGKAITAEDIRVSVKKAWKQVTPAVCKNIRDRVLRNMAIVKVDGRNFYDESMTKTMLGL
jgi:hypothetical protein